MPKILLLDIETYPNIATVWGLFKQNISLNQMLEPDGVLCWAAKWHGVPESEAPVMFMKANPKKPAERRRMMRALWNLLDEADIIVHYNGKRFDVPFINREFLEQRWTPPSPYHQIDLLKTVEKKFRFPSRKLAFVTKQLGQKGKVHVSHELWLACMNNDPEAWAKMQEYNVTDVTELEETYDTLLPWIVQHPNLAMWISSPNPTCSHCGSTKVHKRGYQHLRTQTYQRYQCQSCGTWMRERLAEKRTDKRLVPLDL